MKKLLLLFLSLQSGFVFAGYLQNDFSGIYTEQPLPFLMDIIPREYHTNLYIPVVEFENKLYTNVKLRLESDGRLSLQRSTLLTEEEENWLRKFNDSRCAKLNTFSRVTALRAFHASGVEFCIVNSQSGTDSILTDYLFIENGKATVIKLDSYGSGSIFVIDNITSFELVGLDEEDQGFIYTDLNEVPFGDDRIRLQFYDNGGYPRGL